LSIATFLRGTFGSNSTQATLLSNWICK
jgi:hypothetical protein